MRQRRGNPPRSRGKDYRATVTLAVWCDDFKGGRASLHRELQAEMEQVARELSGGVCSDIIVHDVSISED